MLPPLFPGHRVPPKQILHHRLEMLPEGKLLLCSPCACFLFVWMYEANPSTDPASDMTLPLSLRGRDTGRISKGAHLGGS